MSFDTNDKGLTHVSKEVSISRVLDGSDIKILRAIPRFQIPSKISEETKIHWRTVYRRLKRLLKIRLIRKIGKSPAIYELLPRGKHTIVTFLVPSREATIRSHDLKMISDIIRKPKAFEQKLLKSNWVEYHTYTYSGYKNMVGTTLVLFTPHKVQFILEEFYSDDVRINMDRALKEVLGVIRLLEKRYRGLRISQPTELARIISQEHAIQRDPVAVEFKKSSINDGINYTYKSERLKVDASKGVPELETHHKIYAIEDLERIMRFYNTLVSKEVELSDMLKMMEHLMKLSMTNTMNISKLEKVIESLVKNR